MLKADLHIHTRFSFDADISPEQVVTRCLEVGINCIAITDHGTIEGALKVQEIAPFKVVIGQEIYTQEGELMGLFMKDPIPHGLPALEVAQAIIEQGGIVGIPHPLDRFRSSGKHLVEKLLPYLSFVEVFNARAIFGGDASKLAAYYNLPGTVGSDAHIASEIGRAYVELPSFDTSEEFLKLLRHGRINGHRTSPIVHFLTLAHRVRKLVKGKAIGFIQGKGFKRDAKEGRCSG